MLARRGAPGLCECEFKPNRSTRRRGNVRESSGREQRQTHPPRTARTFAAASCRQTWQKEQESGRLKRVAVVHGGVRCSDVKEKAVSREGLSPVRMHGASSCLRHDQAEQALSTSSPKRLVTARVFTVEWKQQRKEKTFFPLRKEKHFGAVPLR